MPETPVVFRAFPSGEVIALFPSIADGEYGQCLSYMHVGQHGAADYGHVIANTRPATSTDCAALYGELLTLGYDLKLCRRLTPKMHRERMDAHTALARG